jgi:hypothetical protein
MAASSAARSSSAADEGKTAADQDAGRPASGDKAAEART